MTTSKTGFAIQVTPMKQKSWYVQFTRPDQTKVTLTIGEYPSMSLDHARQEASRLYGVHRDGGDIRAAHRTPPKTNTEPDLRTLMEEWWEKANRNKEYKQSTIQSYSSIIRNVITPSAIASYKISDIQYLDVEELYFEESAEHPTQANRMIPILSKILTYAEHHNFRANGTNFCKDFKRQPESSRKRKLSKDEFIKLSAAIEMFRNSGDREYDQSSNGLLSDLFLFCMYSGLRPGEARKLEWGDINFDSPSMEIVDHKTSKPGNESKFLPLNSFLLKILKNREQFHVSSFIFHGRKLDQPIVGYSKPWSKVCELSKLIDFHLHDFRRIWRSQALEFSYPESVVDLLLGHRLPKVRNAYTILDPDGVILRASQEVSQWVHAQTTISPDTQRKVNRKTIKT